MAKDGTLRGGARVGAGRPKQNFTAPVANIPTPVEFNPADLQGDDIPTPKAYLTAEQKDGAKTYAEQIYKETYLWLKACGCENLITKQQIENFAEISARQIQCEQMIDEYGFLSKHPTTGAPIQSPFVKMALDYMRQATNLWLQIYNVVKVNYSRAYKKDSANDKMEKLLRIRRVK